MLLLVLLIGKSCLWLLRKLGRTGSALPGLIVEKLYRPFLIRTLGTLPKGVIVITGTNGKTTTAKVVTELLEADGLRVLTNKTGSNFVRGVVASVIDKAQLSGQLDYDIAVIELDEAHAVHFVRQVRPVGVVALNVMRDQMDRFGEIDTTAKLIAQVAAAAADWVVLNANDRRIGVMAQQPNVSRVVWFGHSKELAEDFITDDQHYHQEELSYYQAAPPAVCLLAHQKDAIRVELHGEPQTFDVQLDGAHNALNITAALAALQAVAPDMSLDKMRRVLAQTTPVFGRGERIHLKNGQLLRLQLIKNPAGFTHSLQLLGEENYQTIGLAINDNYADGRDVSWLWDVNFEALQGKQGKGQMIRCGGSRGWDMAVRLKYDGVSAQVVELSLHDFLAKIIQEMTAPAIIFCTYTAMLELRELLARYSNDLEKISI